MDYRVIKENDLFLMTDKNGDIPMENPSGFGLYTKDTRFISRMEIAINGMKPLLLSSSADENYIAVLRLTNPHMEKDGELILWRESVEITRKRFIYKGGLYESIRLTNFYPKDVKFDFSVLFESDFADMFQVRGFQNGLIGKKTGVSIQTRSLSIGYMGADQIQRETRIKWDSDESVISEDGFIHFDVSLASKQYKEISFFIAPIINGEVPVEYDPEQALKLLEDSYADWNESSTAVNSDSQLFNQLFDRGVQDLRVLLTDLGYGHFPVAGLPWYAVPFGRDSLIAALQMLSMNPQAAKGTLLTMAAYQGLNHDEWRDETPGKIMHEIRYGELANTNQIPFTPYYGTIDATPLFLILAAEYYHWTDDIGFIEQLMPHLIQALSWIDQFGDMDQDSFVEYFQTSSKGIANQGWKDSGDSVVHANGDYAEAPIALVEVQGYVYQAKTRLAPIFRSMGKIDLADKLEEQSRNLQNRFELSFWMEDEKYYAIALDRDKRQVNSVTSNPGHILMSGIAAPDRAKAVAERLIASDMFSGYGIRTMSMESAGYNPMSYHDGSVWPHDNSLSLIGLSRLGFVNEAITIIEGLMRAASKFEYGRLPELFCGYDANVGYPVPYPVACSPQAWAAGTPLVFLQVLLGIEPDALGKRIYLRPTLLPQMNELQVSHLRVGKGSLSLRIQRNKGEDLPCVEVLSNTTGFELQY